MPNKAIEKITNQISQLKAEIKAEKNLKKSAICITPGFLKAMARTRFAPSKRRLLDALLILIWNSPRKEGVVQLQRLIELTELKKATLQRARLELVRLGVIEYTRINAQEGVYLIEENPEKWVNVSTVPPDPEKTVSPEVTPGQMESLTCDKCSEPLESRDRKETPSPAVPSFTQASLASEKNFNRLLDILEETIDVPDDELSPEGLPKAIANDPEMLALVNMLKESRINKANADNRNLSSVFTPISGKMRLEKREKALPRRR
jgi:hypothetical protein